MRLKFVLIFLPFMVYVNAQAGQLNSELANAGDSLYNDRGSNPRIPPRRVMMPIRRIPRPMPQPTPVQRREDQPTIAPAPARYIPALEIATKGPLKRLPLRRPIQQTTPPASLLVPEIDPQPVPDVIPNLEPVPYPTEAPSNVSELDEDTQIVPEIPEPSIPVPRVNRIPRPLLPSRRIPRPSLVIPTIEPELEPLPSPTAAPSELKEEIEIAPDAEAEVPAITKIPDMTADLEPTTDVSSENRPFINPAFRRPLPARPIPRPSNIGVITPGPNPPPIPEPVPTDAAILEPLPDFETSNFENDQEPELMENKSEEFEKSLENPGLEEESGNVWEIIDEEIGDELQHKPDNIPAPIPEIPIPSIEDKFTNPPTLPPLLKRPTSRPYPRPLPTARIPKSALLPTIPPISDENIPSQESDIEDKSNINLTPLEPERIPIPEGEPHLGLVIPTTQPTTNRRYVLPPRNPNYKPIRIPKVILPQPKPNLPVTTSRPPVTTTKKSVQLKPRPSKVAKELPILMDYDCGITGSGFYSFANECDSYVECKRGIAMKYSCPDGLHFNPNSVWPEYPCGYPSEVKCESRSVKQVAQPTSECPRQYGFFALNDGDCSRYISCQEGLATVMNCPVGLAFNPEKTSCDWPENVPLCNPYVFQGFSCPIPPPEEDGRPSDLIYKYRYNNSCNEYLACQRGHPRLLSCDSGLSFDEEMQMCIDSEYVPNCESFK